MSNNKINQINAHTNVPEAPLNSAKVAKNDNTGAQMDIETQNETHEESIKLDQIVKQLFTVNDKVLLDMLNSLFGTEYNIDNTSIVAEDKDFRLLNYDEIRADLLFGVDNHEQVNANDKKQRIHYHVEIQTKNDPTMVVRMVQYGVQKAVKDYNSQPQKEEPLTLYFPKQCVIFLEKNRSIKKKLVVKLVLPDDTAVTYEVPTVRLWKYSTAGLIENKLYPLLPMYLLRIRSKLKNFTKESCKEEYKDKWKSVLQEDIVEITRLVKNLLSRDVIIKSDFETIISAIFELNRFYNKRYIKDIEFERNVEKMSYEEIMEKAKEVVTEYARKEGLAAGRAEGRAEGRAQEIIEFGLEFNLSEEEILNRLKQKLNLDDVEANKYLEKYKHSTSDM